MTYHYYGHNLDYLTFNRIDWILPTKQKNKWTIFPSGPYNHRLLDIIIFLLTYVQTLRRIFHIDFFTFVFPVFLEFFCNIQHTEQKWWKWITCLNIYFEMGWYIGVIGRLHYKETLVHLIMVEVRNGTPNIFKGIKYVSWFQQLPI